MLEQQIPQIEADIKSLTDELEVTEAECSTIRLALMRGLANGTHVDLTSPEFLEAFELYEEFNTEVNDLNAAVRDLRAQLDRFKTALAQPWRKEAMEAWLRESRKESVD